MVDATDILLFVLAFCALWVTIFACWFIWQIALVIRNISEVLKTIQAQLKKLDEAVEFFKAKVDYGTGHLGSMADHVKSAMHYWRQDQDSEKPSE